MLMLIVEQGQRTRLRHGISCQSWNASGGGSRGTGYRRDVRVGEIFVGKYKREEVRSSEMHSQLFIRKTYVVCVTRR